MIPKRIANATHHLGAPPDWDEARDGRCGVLSVRVTPLGEPQRSGRVDFTESAWEPTPEELAALQTGGQVVLRVVGWQVPVMLYVEAASDPVMLEPVS